MQSPAVNSLPYANGASWDPSYTCLPGTRVTLLENIWSWIHSPDAERIFWLSSVAGAGKSAVAHTIAERCREEDLLGSSFFFDHSDEGRNNPKKLFSTIACDLANFNPDIRRQVVSAIELDRSIATAPISRQFDELLCTIMYSGINPVVIVIDALDEGYGADLQLLTILRDKALRLPNKFRIEIGRAHV